MWSAVKIGRMILSNDVDKVGFRREQIDQTICPSWVVSRLGCIWVVPILLLVNQ